MTVPPPSSPGVRTGPAPGWYPDPLVRYDHRYFNGTVWTADVSDQGMRRVDPLGVAPTPGVTTPSPVKRGNGLATASMTCGILAVVTAWIPFIVVVGIVLAVLALVFGLTGRRRAAEVGSGHGFAITGIVTGTLALLLSIVGIVFTVSMYRAVNDFIDAGPVNAELTLCEVDDRRLSVEGELTNRSTEVRGYTVFVELVLDERATGRTFTIQVDEVDPGETATFDASALGVSSEVVCEITHVRGPLPFGIDIGVAIDE